MTLRQRDSILLRWALGGQPEKAHVLVLPGRESGLKRGGVVNAGVVAHRDGGSGGGPKYRATPRRGLPPVRAGTGNGCEMGTVDGGEESSSRWSGYRRLEQQHISASLKIDKQNRENKFGSVLMKHDFAK